MPLSSTVRWARRNLLILAAAGAIVVAVVAVGLIVAEIADREDSLRQADTNLAELGPLSAALRTEPVNVVARGGAAFSDVNVSRGVQREAIRAARASARHWDQGARTAALVETTERTAALSVGVVEAAFREDLAEARLRLQRLLPTAESLSGQVRAARGELRRTLSDRQGEALGFVLMVSALAAAGLILLMASVVGARRRGARVEAAQETLRASERRLQALVRHGSDMITVVGADTTVIYEAGAVQEMLGYEPSELEGTRLTEWVHPDDAPELVALCAAAGSGSSARELRFRRRGGGMRTCEARATSLLGDETWDGIVLNIWDVSGRKQLEERLRHQAFHDGLTGLANRALFADRLEQALRRGERGGYPVTVLLVDLDDFKAINDSFGHVAGDRLLQEVAARLKAAMRAADTVARLGGDEFAVILDEADVDGGAAVERVFNAVESPFKVRGRSFPVSASVGVASSIPGVTAADHLIRNADLAMYAAKAQGKSRWTAYRDDMYVAAEGRLQLKADLAHAVAGGEQLHLAYQPVVDLESGELAGMEALLRWDHPTRGEVEPAEFIPLAEESGAIVPLGRRVLVEACRQARAWLDLTGLQLMMAVNVSTRQISGEGFVGEVRGALEDSGLPPEHLLLEVTESQLMRDREQAAAVLRELKELGLRIAIDDFGTGYSSLSQLEQLPVDVIKVDRSLASADHGGAPGHERLLRAVAEMGRSLRLRTVIEGIETAEQLAEAGRLEFDCAQGFVFARPMDAAAMTALLRDGGRPSGSAAGLNRRPVLQPSAE